MPGDCVFSNDLLRRELKQLPKEFATVKEAKDYLTKKIGAFYTVSVYRDGKWGKFSALITHKRKGVQITGFSDDLRGLVRRLLVTA